MENIFAHHLFFSKKKNNNKIEIYYIQDLNADIREVPVT